MNDGVEVSELQSENSHKREVEYDLNENENEEMKENVKQLLSSIKKNFF